jgi:hypothetical protein
MTQNLSSKKYSNPSDISGILQNKKLVEKPAHSDEGKLLNTDEINGSDFLDKEDYALLPDSGNNNSDECLYGHHNFLWEDMDDYSGLTKFLPKCVDLKIVQSVTDLVDIFELLFIRLWYRKWWIKPIVMHNN